jgi:hypothetical protein
MTKQSQSYAWEHWSLLLLGGSPLLAVQVGQTMSGKFLSLLTGKWGSKLSYAHQIQLLMFMVVR